MTMVFGGIDLPIFEMLFIVSVLLLCGLFVMILGIFYILKELRSLKKDLKKEEENIQVFEKDIQDLEKFENKSDENPNKEIDISNYIKENLAKGYTWAQLKQHLISQGWDEKQIEKLYNKIT